MEISTTVFNLQSGTFMKISTMVLNLQSGHKYMVEMAMFNVQREISPKVGKSELQFMSSAHCLMEF